MEFYIIPVILASLVHMLDGHKVPVLTVCSSMCSIKRDGSFYSVMCHTNTPNSFRVNTSVQPSILTGRQMIERICQEGISGAKCVSPKGSETDRREFRARTIYMTCDRGTYSFNLKKKKWNLLMQFPLKHLCGDPIGQRVLGVKHSLIIALKEHQSGLFLNCRGFLASINDFDYDVNLKEAFMLDNLKRIFRMKKALPKLRATSHVRGLRLDQRNKKIYLTQKDVSFHNIVCLSYEGNFLQTINRVQERITFRGHFDNFGIAVLVWHHGTRRFIYMPHYEKVTVQHNTMDTDYDDDFVYALGQHGLVEKMKRGETASTKLGKPEYASIGFNIAVV